MHNDQSMLQLYSGGKTLQWGTSKSINAVVFTRPNYAILVVSDRLLYRINQAVAFRVMHCPWSQVLPSTSISFSSSTITLARNNSAQGHPMGNPFSWLSQDRHPCHPERTKRPEHSPDTAEPLQPNGHSFMVLFSFKCKMSVIFNRLYFFCFTKHIMEFQHLHAYNFRA